MTHTLEIDHDLGNVTVLPVVEVDRTRLKRMIRSTLDSYMHAEHVPAQAVHDEARQRHGDSYMTPGYHLRLYRLRAGFTQTELAGRTGMHQRHLSEMENNKRPLGKTTARKLARILGCDYRRLL